MTDVNEETIEVKEEPVLPAAEEGAGTLPKSKVQGLRYWTSPVNEGGEPPHTQYPKRAKWSEGNRKTQNPAGKWLVNGPINDRERGLLNTSKTLTRGKDLFNADSGLLDEGAPNKQNPNPDDASDCMSNIIDHGFTANRAARRGA